MKSFMCPATMPLVNSVVQPDHPSTNDAAPGPPEDSDRDSVAHEIDESVTSARSASDRERDADVSDLELTGRTHNSLDEDGAADVDDRDKSNPVSVQGDTSDISLDFASDGELDGDKNIFELFYALSVAHVTFICIALVNDTSAQPIKRHHSVLQRSNEVHASFGAQFSPGLMLKNFFQFAE